MSKSFESKNFKDVFKPFFSCYRSISTATGCRVGTINQLQNGIIKMKMKKKKFGQIPVTYFGCPNSICEKKDQRI